MVAGLFSRSVPRNLVTCSSVAVTPGLVTAKLSFANVANELALRAVNQGCVSPASSACCMKVASESKMDEVAIAQRPTTRYRKL